MLDFLRLDVLLDLHLSLFFLGLLRGFLGLDQPKSQSIGAMATKAINNGDGLQVTRPT